ncbi:MAG: radical SAM protein [Dysgonamonadaceae bacterium]
MICFGPIPSRRLGKSLGVNNIPNQKICSYSCVYCQIGARQRFSYERMAMYKPEEIREEVAKHLNKLKADNKPDFITFVANGEPTLDINLGESILLLKEFNIPIAVITNGTLLDNAQVRDELMEADWVSIKIDAAEESIWSKINRPHHSLNFDDICEGKRLFAKQFQGILVSETMLIDDINDNGFSVECTAYNVFLTNPSKAYISIPTRPPAISGIKPASPEAVNTAYHIFTHQGLNTELILGFEGTNTGYTGNAKDDILNICSVHPIREDTMRELLHKDNANSSVLNELLESKQVIELEYDSLKFYLRNR